MTLALTVLSIVTPVFVLALIGFVWDKMGFDYRIEFVTRLTMSLSVPCLIFVALMQTEIDPRALAQLTLAALASYGAVAAVFAGLLVMIRASVRTFLPPLTFGNTGNLGLPLAVFAFGDTGLGLAVVVFAVMAILSFTAGVWIVAGGGSLFKVLREPLVGATLAGALCLWQGWHLPQVATNTLELIGQMAIPLMLITLGVAVARLHVAGLARAVALAVAKFAVCAAVAWIIGGWFALEPMARAVLVVQLSTPVAVTSYLLAEKYGADSQAVAGMVVTSTLISVIGLPLILAWLL